jgi:hypothetical protein
MPVRLRAKIQDLLRSPPLKRFGTPILHQSSASKKPNNLKGSGLMRNL